MDLYEAVEKRRTVRSFVKAVPEKTLRRILVAGAKALSAGNSQPWEFIRIDDPKLIDQLAEHKYQQNLERFPPEQTLKQKKAYQNCSVVAVCHKEGQAVSAWACIQNMALAATAEGLGILPSTFWGEHQIAVEKLLGLPEGYKLATVMLVGVQEGYPNADYPKPPRRPEFSWLHKNRFGVPHDK
jgi:5,6-dimethylbenzimidazole synthase